MVNATATGPSSRKRALVIDDDAPVRKTLHAIVTGLGFQTDAAANGSEGLRHFESNPYDVVLTDLLMPGMTGWQVLEAVRERNPKIPVRSAGCGHCIRSSPLSAPRPKTPTW